MSHLRQQGRISSAWSNGPATTLEKIAPPSYKLRTQTDQPARQPTGRLHSDDLLAVRICSLRLQKSSQTYHLIPVAPCAVTGCIANPPAWHWPGAGLCRDFRPYTSSPVLITAHASGEPNIPSPTAPLPPWSPRTPARRAARTAGAARPPRRAPRRPPASAPRAS